MEDVTIYDIAEKAGVSASTVSRVINNYPYIKKSTREKVLKLLEKYNYVPNETARGLVNKSPQMIGILISDVRTAHHAGGVYYIEREFTEQGYSSLIFNTGTDKNKWAGYLQAMSQRKVDGVVLMGSIYQTEEIQEAIRTYIPTTPVVIMNGFLDLPNVYGVIAGEQNGVCDLVQLFAQKGRKELAFIVNGDTPSNRLKQNGFEEGVARACGKKRALVLQTGSSIQEICDTTYQLMKEHPETNGIIYADDMSAAIGLRALANIQRSVPEDVAVAGINNSQYAQICIPTLTSLDNMLYDLSLMAARNLISLLKGEHVNKKMMIFSQVMERQSTDIN